jgi:hypothetical protein
MRRIDRAPSKCCPIFPASRAIALRVEVLEVEFTDLSPGCGSDECIPFDFWYKYRAKVKEVISGDWNQPEVAFTNLQHAEFIDKVTRDCYVVLRPAGKELQFKIGVPFAAERLLSLLWKPDRAVIKALRDGA